MKRVLLPLLTILLSIGASYSILCIWGGTSLDRGRPSRENLLRAIQFTPSNPDPYYRLGVLYQWEIRHIDLKRSLKLIAEAISRNPLEQQYYLDLARILQRMGEEDAAEEALEKAILTFPSGYEGRWVAGNLLLQQGALEKALFHFTDLLKNYPHQSGMVYDVLLRAIRDTEFILEKVVPREPSAMNQYISYLYEIGDKESAKKAWRKKKSWSMKDSRSETLRHIEFLIAQGDLNEAFQAWRTRLREEGFPVLSDGNRITNGGFEKKEILGGGFDWKTVKVAGAEISVDDTVAFEGKRSLKIVFTGKENVDFYHVYQFVSLEPDRDYILRAHVKTRSVTTQSGLKIEITGVGPGLCETSESLTGDNGWKEMTLSFRTPPRSQGVLFRVKRERTDKLHRLISGTVWIDNVQLREKSRTR
jgi:hypothetical protein